MNIGKLVEISLFVVVFLFGSIFLIGFVKEPLFLYTYFIFSFLLLITISLSIKKAYSEEIKFSFLIIIIIFIALSLTLFGQNLKNYYEKNNEIVGNLSSNFQIGNIEKTNDYYESYISFINGEILKTKQISLDLQSQIDNLIAQKNSINKSPNIPQDNTPIYLYEEEEDD